MEDLKRAYFEWGECLKERYGLWTSIAIMQKVLNNWICSIPGNRCPNAIELRIAVVAEVGELLNELGTEWKWWAKKKEIDKEKVLEELVDVLHFYMSMVVYDYEVEDIKEWQESSWGMYDSEYDSKLLVAILGFINEISDVGNAVNEITDMYFGEIVRALGFDYNEVWQKYVEKSFKNYVRQVSNGRYGKIPESELVKFAKENWKCGKEYVLIDGEGNVIGEIEF